MSLLTFKPAGRRTAAAADFGKVAVLLGGDSSEREISLLERQRRARGAASAAASMRMPSIRRIVPSRTW